MDEEQLKNLVREAVRTTLSEREKQEIKAESGFKKFLDKLGILSTVVGLPGAFYGLWQLATSLL
jgi:hypothetical protein